MKKTKIYHLAKGKKIGNKSLPGGQLTAEKCDVEIKKADLDIIKDSIPFLLKRGIIVDKAKSDAKKAKEDEAKKLKADKLQAEKDEAEKLEAEKLEADKKAAEKIEADKLEAEEEELEKMLEEEEAGKNGEEKAEDTSWPTESDK